MFFFVRGGHKSCVIKEGLAFTSRDSLNPSKKCILSSCIACNHQIKTGILFRLLGPV